MNQLNEQVTRAHRRLLLEQFINRFVWRLFILLLLAVIAIAIPRIVAISGLPTWWSAAWLGGAAAVALLSAAVETAFFRKSRLDAAIEIDRRFGLRERVASSLSLSESDQTTEAGQAVLRDAVKSISRVDVGEKFRVSFHRRAWAPIVPALIAVALVAFFDNRTATSTTTPVNPQLQKADLEKTVEELQKLAQRTKKNEEKGDSADVSDLLKDIEKAVADLNKSNKEEDRKKVVVKLNDLAKQLEDRKQQLGGKEALQEQFEKMNDLGKGPAEKVADAVKEGDLQKAMQEMQKMQDKLASGKLSEEEKKQLGQQFAEMKKSLNEAVEAQKQAMDDLKKQIEQQRQKGNLAQANQLQQKLDQMQQKSPQMQKLQQLAQQMGEAQQALEKGDSKAAADAMSKMAQQLEKMQQQMDAAEMMDGDLNQLQALRDQMACEQCSGMGCEACMGKNAMNMMGMGQQMGQGMGMGMGMGEGEGRGPRPDEENPVNFRDSQVKQNVGVGNATFGGLVNGPNLKGDVQQQIQQEQEALGAKSADPLTAERLPRSRQDQAEQYFSSFRD